MSPIIGLTDEVAPRFPRLGKLRKGGEKTEKGYGADLDHFRFTSENAEIAKSFEGAYGKEPRLINVFLPHAHPADAFQTWSEVWAATGLVHRCDGKIMTVWMENGKYARGNKPCMGGHEKGDYLNDAVGRLDLIIPELVMAGHVGYVTLETHSKHDMINIMSVLQAASDEGRRDLRGIPFILRRVEESVSTPGFGNQVGKRSRVNKWLVRLEPHQDWVQLQMGMAKSAALGEGAEDLPALPEPSKPAGMTIEEAVAFKTPGGLSFGSLTDEQLKVVIEKGKNGTGEVAKFLLEPAMGNDWETWYELSDRPGWVDLQEGTSRINLYRRIKDLQK